MTFGGKKITQRKNNFEDQKTRFVSHSSIWLMRITKYRYKQADLQPEERANEN